MGKNKGHGL